MVMCYFFKKGWTFLQVYNFIIFCYKKNIVKHIFKESKNWSKVIHYSLQIPYLICNHWPYCGQTQP